MQDLTRRSGEPLLEDRALPGLATVLDAERMAARLRPLVHGAGPLAVTVLKHTAAKRCVVGFRFENGARAIGKLYRKDRARRHADVLRDLGAILTGSTRVPQLLDCDEALGLVVQQWVPGGPVPEFDRLGGFPLERLGEALADLHTADIADLPAADLAAHVRRTCHPGLEALAAELPALAAELRAVQTALFEREARLARCVRTCHGDYSPRQIFDDGAIVYVVDLDGIARSHPALDVANFRVGLAAHLGPEGEAAGGRFLAAYRRRSGEPLEGLEVYEAFAWVRRATIAWRKRPAGWEAQVAQNVRRGLELVSA